MPAEARLPEPWRHPAFHELRARIETLEEENRQLRAALKPELAFPRAWRLSRQQAAVLGCLYAKPGYHTLARLHVAILGADSENDPYHVRTLISLARPKLRAVGIEIVTVHCQGYALAPEGRAVVDEALAAIAAGRAA